MKFEADIIKEILDSRGHEKPSIHYQSECVEEWVKEVEGAYPKLCDYRPEWLNYSNENKIGVFPYMTLTNVTNATVENVVPYGYKSAILKGNTLINLADGYKHNVTVVSKAWGQKKVALNNIKNNTTYTMKVEIQQIVTSNFTPNVEVRLRGGNYSETTTTGGVIKFTSGDEVFDTHLRLVVTGANPESANINFKVLVLEGDYTNIDIPYFEGIQSVQMPVLTTSNEDGTKTNILTVNEEVELRGIGDIQDELNLLTGELTERIGEITFDGSDDETWRFDTSEPWTNGEYCTFNIHIQTSSIPGYNVNAILTLNNKYPDISYTQGRNGGIGCFLYSGGGQAIAFRQKDIDTLEDWKTYLQSNPITVQYRLATESIKTVDLSVVDQNGNEREQIKPIEGIMHISTSGESINPLFSGDIPVEAITQNLASFIYEEE